VNRLAKNGTSFINHGDVCDPLEEAKAAIGAEEIMAKESFENMSSSNSGKKEEKKKKKSGGKKELSEKQKAVLAKLKQSK